MHAARYRPVLDEATLCHTAGVLLLLIHFATVAVDATQGGKKKKGVYGGGLQKKKKKKKKEEKKGNLSDSRVNNTHRALCHYVGRKE